mgnify:CR=1 FL=1
MAETRIMHMDIASATERLWPWLLNGFVKVAVAIVLYMIGRWLIDFAVRMVSRVLTAREFDPTLQRYIANILSVVLNVLLIVAILGYFGLQTTSFAALLAGVGLAVGAAWSGLLGNFAAGAFLIIFRPYKVGDYVIAAGVEGVVMEIGMFETVINTPENVMTVVGNSKVSNDVIQNFSANTYRRVAAKAFVPLGTDPLAVMAEIERGVAGLPNVLATPAPEVQIAEFTDRGTFISVQPCSRIADFPQVTADTNRFIAEMMAKTRNG